MTIFKSRQVNLDPKPWATVADLGGVTGRYGTEREAQRWCMAGEFIERYPRPEFEPTRDPEPWEGFHGRSYAWVRLADPSSDRRHFTEIRWSPRREQFDTQVNPILAELRELRGASWARPELYRDQYLRYLRWIDQVDASSEDDVSWTAEQRDHARRVLARLANWRPS